MSDPAPLHVSVLPEEVLHWLDPQPGQTIIDGTLGAGGHTRLLAERVGQSGQVISLDRDPAALAAAERTLAGLPVMVAHSDFAELDQLLEQLSIKQVDGILLDLGLSSDQLADRERGFSFDADGELDMRFDTTTGEPAWGLLARLRERELADLIYQYGEERFSRRIARVIVERREVRPVRAAGDLAELVRRCIPGRRKPGQIDPATRTFQALRIAVNHELRSLEQALESHPALLAPGGRMAVISFHSLEDRRVKEAFRDDPRLEVLTRRPVKPTEAEIAANPRSRSSRLRVARREV